MTFLLHYLKPIKSIIGIVVILSLLSTFGTLFIPTMMAKIVNDGVLLRDWTTIEDYSLYMVLASLATVIVTLASFFIAAHGASKVGQALRQDTVNQILQLSTSDFTSYGAGTLMMRSTRDVEKLQSVFDESLVLILPMPLMIITGLGLTFYTSTGLGLIILAVMILLILFMILLQNRIIPIVKAIQQRLDGVTDLIRDHITGMAAIRTFNRTTYESHREQAAFTGIATLATKRSQIFALALPTVLFIFNASTVCILWLGGYQVSESIIEVGDIMAVIEYATLILLHLIMAIFVIADIPEALVCLHRIREIVTHSDRDQTKLSELATHRKTMNEEAFRNIACTSKPEKTVATQPSRRKDAVSLLSVEQLNQENSAEDMNVPLLSVEHITFRYDNAEMPALEDITFTLEKGQHLAIMGDIGSGKSTIVGLIDRLFIPESGDIKLKGQSIYTMTAKDVRSHIGYVPQKAYLFTGSIRENLTYGLIGQTITTTEMDRAMYLSCFDEALEKFEDRYDHHLTQGGSNLSGGQRQRLAMARALIRRSEITIFDDSFSALDGTTERIVRDRLREARRRGELKSMISIEQKVSAAKEADKILVISEGKIVGYGTHEALLVSSPIYREIVTSQEGSHAS